jgi:Flp pilus assembly protein TadG
MIAPLKRLWSDRRGSIIVEMALVAPVLGTLIIGVVDISNAYSRKLALEQGAHRAIEKIMQTTDYQTVEDTLKSEAICQVNGMNTDGTCKTSPITSSDATVTWRFECLTATKAVASTQTTTDTTTFDSYSCSGTNTESRYVSITLADKYTPIFPLHFSSLDADGTYHLSASAGMRVE